MSVIRVGVAEVDFTPPPGLPIMGHIRDDYAARGVHDPLRARALVVANAAGARAALLTLDLCMLNRAHARMMREHIGAHSWDFAGEYPDRRHSYTWRTGRRSLIYGVPPPRAAEVERFLKKAAQAVIQADQRLKPAVAEGRLRKRGIAVASTGGCGAATARPT